MHHPRVSICMVYCLSSKSQQLAGYICMYTIFAFSGLVFYQAVAYHKVSATPFHQKGTSSLTSVISIK